MPRPAAASSPTTGRFCPDPFHPQPGFRLRERVKKVSQSLPPLAANKVQTMFRRGVYLAEHTLQAASVEFVPPRGTNDTRSRLQKSVGKPRRGFSTVCRSRVSGGGFFCSCIGGWAVLQCSRSNSLCPQRHRQRVAAGRRNSAPFSSFRRSARGIPAHVPCAPRYRCALRRTIWYCFRKNAEGRKVA